MRKPSAIALALVGIGLFLFATPVLAHNVRDAPCLQTATTNFEFGECTRSIIEEADSRLNAAWKRLFNLMGRSKTAEGRELLTEQRAWIAFRDKACGQYWQDSGREGVVFHGPLCIANIIASRADDLEGRAAHMSQDSSDKPRN